MQRPERDKAMAGPTAEKATPPSEKKRQPRRVTKGADCSED